MDVASAGPDDLAQTEGRASTNLAETSSTSTDYDTTLTTIHRDEIEDVTADQRITDALSGIG